MPHPSFAAERVDMQLVLLADTSVSMDREEKQLQQQGFAKALRNPKILSAIMGGPTRRISVTYVEWGGDRPPRVVIPWTIIDSPLAAYEFSARLERNFPSRMTRGTSISTALNCAQFLFETSPFEAPKNVINISGDGVNNNGQDLAAVRAHVLSKGVTINGMPIIYKGLMEGVVSSSEADMPRELLLDYYRTEVIGGPGAFIQPVVAKSNYSEAIFKKLLREIEASTKSAGIDGGGPQMADSDVLSGNSSSVQ